MTTTMSAKWLRRLRPSIDPDLRLVCLPYAGGTAGSFTTWITHVPDWIELLAVQYPGRQDRIGEPCVDDIRALADEIVAALEPLADRPLSLFGHSMGALIAYEVALRLEESTADRLQMLFVSGQRAPHEFNHAAEKLSDAEVEAEIRYYGWVDSSILDDPEICDAVLPSLIADFRAAFSYRRHTPQLLRAPVVAYAGRDEPNIAAADLQRWSELSTSESSHRLFDGDHFYLADRPDDLVADIVTRLSNQGASPVGRSPQP